MAVMKRSDYRVSVAPGHKFMLEASFVLSEDGVAWLTGEGAEHLGSIVISQALIRGIQRQEPSTLAWFYQISEDTLGRLAEVVGRAQPFSHEQAGIVSPNADIVRTRLFAEQVPDAAEILVDEWIFLETQSWVGARSRRAFDAFVEAGAELRELPRPIGRRLVARTLKKQDLPEHIPLKMLILAGMKWIAVGGAPALILVPPPVSIPLGIAAGVFILIDP
jgi:hypothetical protein